MLFTVSWSSLKVYFKHEKCWIIHIFHYFYHKNVRKHKVLYIKMISRKRRLILVFVNVFINCFWKKFIILILRCAKCHLLLSSQCFLSSVGLSGGIKIRDWTLFAIRKPFIYIILTLTLKRLIFFKKIYNIF